jgi:hypothetical protein
MGVYLGRVVQLTGSVIEIIGRPQTEQIIPGSGVVFSDTTCIFEREWWAPHCGRSNAERSSCRLAERADGPTAGADLVSLAPSCTVPGAAISSATPSNHEING